MAVVESRYMIDFLTRYNYLVLIPTVQIALKGRICNTPFWSVSVAFLFWSLSIMWSNKAMFLRRK